VDSPILFDSFEQHLTMPRLLDRIGTLFSSVLVANGVQWLTLDDQKRRQLALGLLRRVPVLWIWDNVEQVAGFPAGTESVWTTTEQKELADFLRDLAGTKARVLITSRRDETTWLGEFPMRVRVPPMPRQDRIQLAAALIRHHGRDARTVAALEPLLEFSRGNPLTVGVVTRQALRDGITTGEAAADLARRLQDGEKAFLDDEEQGRSRSLGASLAYGFAQGFDEAERRRLALLCLFQGKVNAFVVALLELRIGERQVGGAEHREVANEWRALLSRAAEIGLLTAQGGDLFDVHPALSWFFRSLFDRPIHKLKWEDHHRQRRWSEPLRKP